MKKLLLLLLPLLLLCGCTSREPAREANADLDFSLYYHGFIISPGQYYDGIPVPRGSALLSSREEYGEFFSAYELAAIYPLETVDFETESLLYLGIDSAMPFRGWSGKVQAVRLVDGVPEVIWDETVNFNAENEAEAVAYQIVGDGIYVDVCEVFLIKLQKADLEA